ncbi:MAG: carboxypeptidase regulatory-like domain-containing protein [bacterium]|nr:carboxypeptidase regulatory-like domain-containing protein [bacterium]
MFGTVFLATTSITTVYASSFFYPPVPAPTATTTLEVSTATLSGRVTTQQTGSSISGATVNLSLGGSIIATTTTNVLGNYTFAELGAGSHTVSVVTPSGYLTATDRIVNISIDTGTSYTGINFPLQSIAPAKPTNISPANGSTTTTVTPTLSASSYSDPQYTHGSSMWRVYSSPTLCSAGGNGDIVNLTSVSSLTSYLIPSGKLAPETKYYWRVSYRNSFGNASNYSNCTYFTTVRTKPTFSNTVPDQTWNEDASLVNALDLDAYFSDAEGEVLSYSVIISTANITAPINSSTNQVTFTSGQNWNGVATATFRACDTDNECINSNTFALTVNSVNDAPGKPITGFSPASGNRAATLVPRISWDASVDVDHSFSELKYELRIGTSSTPRTTFLFNVETSLGSASKKLTNNLIDETTYYYVVRAVDPDGAKSAWSDVQTFDVNLEFAPNVSMVKEVSLATDIANSLNTLQAVMERIVGEDSAQQRNIAEAFNVIMAELVAEPSNKLLVTIRYENSGDGDATSVLLTDTFPIGTQLVDGSLLLNNVTQTDATISGTGLSFLLGTIPNRNDTPNNQGEIKYIISINNPFAFTSVDFASSTMTANEFGNAVLSNTVSIPLTVSSVSGQIYDSANNPVAGVVLNLLLDDETVVSVTTDENGNYSFDGVGSGDYTVGIVPPSGYVVPDAVTLNIGIDSETTGVNYQLALETTNQPVTEPVTEETQTEENTTTEEITEEDVLVEEQTVEEVLQERKREQIDKLREQGVPEELIQDFIKDLPILTPEQQETVDDLTDEFNIESVNNESVEDLSLTTVAESIGFVTNAVEGIQDFFFPPEPEDIIIGGVALPNSKVIISICYDILETQSDSQGQWVMNIPPDLLPPGENVLYATTQTEEGQVTDRVEVARVVVDEKSSLLRTAVIGNASIAGGILILNIILYFVYISKYSKLILTDVKERWKITSIVTGVVGLGMLVAAVMLQAQDTYNIEATGTQPQDNILVSTVNDRSIANGASMNELNVDTVTIQGEAPSGAAMAITLCDDQPLKTIKVADNGIWTIDIPVKLLPKAQFRVSAQAMAVSDLGEPHRLLEMSVVREPFAFIVRLLFIFAYLSILSSVATFWIHLIKHHGIAKFRIQRKKK